MYSSTTHGPVSDLWSDTTESFLADLALMMQVVASAWPSATSQECEKGAPHRQRQGWTL